MAGSIAVGTITNGGDVVLDRSDDLTFTTLIIGTGGFMKNNIHNTVTITNANSYTGVTWLNYGTLLITNPDALGTNLTFISEDDTALLMLSGGITLLQPITLDMKTGGYDVGQRRPIEC